MADAATGLGRLCHLACPHLCKIAISSLIIREAFHECLLARSKVVARP
jgi:hypothetical protein